MRHQGRPRYVISVIVIRFLLEKITLPDLSIQNITLDSEGFFIRRHLEALGY